MERRPKLHVVVVPCPALGHINPQLQFAKYLVHRGLKVTLPAIVTTVNSTHLSPDASLAIEQVSLLPYEGDELESPRANWDRRQESIRLHVTKLLACHQGTDDSIACIVHDSMTPWMSDVAKKFGVSRAAFFTQSTSVNAIYYNIHKGWLDLPLQEGPISLEGFSTTLQPSDLPPYASDSIKYASTISFMTSQFTGLDDADWIFVNTFDSLELQEAEWMRKQYPFKNIGPMVPSLYLNGWLPNDREYGASIFESKNTDSTMKWLDSKDDSSVVYVSFGSLTEAKEELMEEVAWGLKLSNKFFLWVVRESEIDKLPPNFIEETAEKGLVVNWCSQLEVLSHKSVGCFVTHCGLNSTLEALSLGVPLVAIPLSSDQPTNAKYVEDVWKIGKRVTIEEDGICIREQIEVCVNEVMEAINSNEIRENLKKLREMAKAAMDEGGSSNININHFVDQLVMKAQL